MAIVAMRAAMVTVIVVVRNENRNVNRSDNTVTMLAVIEASANSSGNASRNVRHNGASRVSGHGSWTGIGDTVARAVDSTGSGNGSRISAGNGRGQCCRDGSDIGDWQENEGDSRGGDTVVIVIAMVLATKMMRMMYRR